MSDSDNPPPDESDEAPASPYPDGPGGEPPSADADDHGDADPQADVAAHELPDAVTDGPVPPLPPRGQPFGNAEYPAGPPQHPLRPAAPQTNPDQQQFRRRAPQHGPRPDADGYYPHDYYLGPDWTRIVVGGLATIILVVGVAALGIYLFDRYDPRDSDEEETAEATATPVPLVSVFECAGDPDPVTEMTAPSSLLIAGRTGDSRWLAFRNPVAPPLQLWVPGREYSRLRSPIGGRGQLCTQPQ